MSDDELLALAAKAINGGTWHPLTHEMLWNPLTDDGDALRLLVVIGAGLNTSHPETLCFSSKIDVSEPHSSDKFSATRRAIVKVAAAIGAATKGQK